MLTNDSNEHVTSTLIVEEYAKQETSMKQAGSKALLAACPQMKATCSEMSTDF
jgi:hypothetical protein